MAIQLHTFKDTGVQVRIRKVSPLLILKLRESFPPPKPPMQDVEQLDGKKTREPNPAHPDYVQALADHDALMEQRVRKLLITRGVEFEWTEERRLEVAEIRQSWREMYDQELDGDDKEVYISYVAIGSGEDLTELIEAVARRSQPTEAEVENALSRFPN